MKNKKVKKILVSKEMKRLYDLSPAHVSRSILHQIGMELGVEAAEYVQRSMGILKHNAA